jgi:hypothetical protein
MANDRTLSSRERRLWRPIEQMQAEDAGPWPDSWPEQWKRFEAAFKDRRHLLALLAEAFQWLCPPRGVEQAGEALRNYLRSIQPLLELDTTLQPCHGCDCDGSDSRVRHCHEEAKRNVTAPETLVQPPQTTVEMDLESACNWLACFADSESPIIRIYVRRLMEKLQPCAGTLAAKVNSPSDGHALKAEGGK